MLGNDYNRPQLVVEHLRYNQRNLPLTVGNSPYHLGGAALTLFYTIKDPLLFQFNSDSFILKADELLVTWPDVKIDWVAKDPHRKEVLKITCYGDIGLDNKLMKFYSSDLPFFILKQNACVTRQLCAGEKKLSTETEQLRFEILVHQSLEVWKKDLALLDRVEAQKICTKHILFTRLRKARLFIDRYYTSPITVPVIARACNMSATYFIKHFTMVFDISPRQYIIQKRITLAKQLFLQNTALKEVVERTGFENDSSFCRLFKKSTGCTSTQYVSSLKAIKTDSLVETY